MLATLAPVPMPLLFPVKAPLGAFDQLPELVKGCGVLIGQLATVSFDGDSHLVRKTKAPKQHKVIRALGVTVWADWKRLFLQPWVEFTATGVRLFLTKNQAIGL